jgi:hypothetical protein
MGLLSSLLPAPKEISACMRELEALEDEMSASFVTAGFERVRREAKKYVDAKRDQHVELLRSGKVTPRIVALILSRNIAGHLALSGQFHVYRGALGIEGESLRDIYLHAVNELERMGYVDAAQSAADRKAMRDGVADCG